MIRRCSACLTRRCIGPDEPLPDQRVMEAHRAIYLSRFSPEKYAKYVRIPRQPDAEPLPKVAWNE